MDNLITKRFGSQKVRIFNIKGNPYFSVYDACKVLDISNSRDATSRLDKDDVGITDVIDSLGRKQRLVIISEGALYELIFRSRKKEAKAFKRWIMHEVIPSIRKTGSYSIPGALKKKSTKTRNLLTNEWAEHNIIEPKHFAYLTLEEYRQLQFQKNKRKKDFDAGELKTLMALEALEMVSLHYNPIEGYIECKENLKHTAKKVIEVKEGKVKKALGKL